MFLSSLAWGAVISSLGPIRATMPGKNENSLIVGRRARSIFCALTYMYLLISVPENTGETMPGRRERCRHLEEVCLDSFGVSCRVDSHPCVG
jgi:hypothetical protein